MQIPENIDQLLESTPFGRVTVDFHRAYGTTQMVKARQRIQVKTQSVEECGALIGKSLGEVINQSQSGHIEVEVTFKQGRLQFTIIETFID